MPTFYHDRNTVNFLKELQFVGEFDTIDKIGLSGIPTVFGRKLYEYRTKTGAVSNKFIEAKDNDWPFPDMYFISKGCSVRGFSFAFPNASAKLKEHLLPSKNLLNVRSGTEEVDNVLTQNDFFPIQKNIKDKIDEFNSTPEKNFVNESYFLYDKSNLILDTFITALNKKISIYGSFSYSQDKTEEEKIRLLSAGNFLKFSANKNTLKDELKFQLTNISGKNPKTRHKKIHDFSITRLGRKGNCRWQNQFKQWLFTHSRVLRL